MLNPLPSPSALCKAHFSRKICGQIRSRFHLRRGKNATRAFSPSVGSTYRAVPTRAAAAAAPEARPASQRAVAGLGPRPALQPPRPRIPTAAPATAASPTVRGGGCGAGGGGGGETGSWAARLTGRGRGSPLLSVPTCAPSPRPRFLKSFPAPEAPPGGGPHLCRCHPGPCRGARHRLGRGGYASRIPECPPGLILPDIQLQPNAIIFGAK